MSSRKYRIYPFLYDDELGKRIVKIEKVYLDDSELETTPITQSFLDRTINLEGQITEASLRLRHLTAYKENRAIKASLPYNSSDSRLAIHIREILSTDGVNCGSYQGESLTYNGSTNSI